MTLAGNQPTGSADSVQHENLLTPCRMLLGNSQWELFQFYPARADSSRGGTSRYAGSKVSARRHDVRFFALWERSGQQSFRGFPRLSGHVCA